MHNCCAAPPELFQPSRDRGTVAPGSDHAGRLLRGGVERYNWEAVYFAADARGVGQLDQRGDDVSGRDGELDDFRGERSRADDVDTSLRHP
jgi:hypothetical protein